MRLLRPLHQNEAPGPLRPQPSPAGVKAYTCCLATYVVVAPLPAIETPQVPAVLLVNATWPLLFQTCAPCITRCS